MKLEGLVYLIPTPLHEDETVDVPAARGLVGRAIETGADVLWVIGSGGEQPFLTDSQRRVMLETAVAEAGGRAPVIAGAMDCSTNRALANLDMLAEAGCDYATLLPPYYFTLSQAQIVAFYTRLAERGPLPAARLRPVRPGARGGEVARGQRSARPRPSSALNESPLTLTRDSHLFFTEE